MENTPYPQIAYTLVFQGNQELSWEPGTGQSRQTREKSRTCPTLSPKNIGALAAGEWAAGGGAGRVASPEETALKVDKLEEKDTQAGI